jgi:nicotinamidase-related amidase
MVRSTYLLDRGRSALVALDLQEPFLRSIHGREGLLASCGLLIRAARLLGVPALLTTQYAQRMGPVIPEIASVPAPELGPSVTTAAPAAATRVPEPSPVIDKLSFSAVGERAFLDALRLTGRRQVLLCGVETHICVGQTALDLLHAGYEVHVAPDAVSSRTQERHKLGMERMRDAGVRPVAAEAAVYEWLREAGTPEFKTVLELVR